MTAGESYFAAAGSAAVHYMHETDEKEHTMDDFDGTTDAFADEMDLFADLDEAASEGWLPEDVESGTVWHWVCAHPYGCDCPGSDSLLEPACGEASGALGVEVPTSELPAGAVICDGCRALAFDAAGGWGAAPEPVRTRQRLADAWPAPVVEVAPDPDGIRTPAVPVLPEVRIDWTHEGPGGFALAVYDDATGRLLAYHPSGPAMRAGSVWLAGMPPRVFFHPVAEGPWRLTVRNGERVPDVDDLSEVPDGVSH